MSAKPVAAEPVVPTVHKKQPLNPSECRRYAGLNIFIAYLLITLVWSGIALSTLASIAAGSLSARFAEDNAVGATANALEWMSSHWGTGVSAVLFGGLMLILVSWQLWGLRAELFQLRRELLNRAVAKD